MIAVGRIFFIIKIFFLILLIWGVQILFLPEVVKLGLMGDDWRWLTYHDGMAGDRLDRFLYIWNDRNPYDAQQAYYIGTLKRVFGLNQTAFKLTDILFKSLAALSLGFLAFKVTQKKLLALMTVFFFIISPPAAGILDFTTLGSNYLSIVFICFYLYLHIESLKNIKMILPASLFFLLALLAGPARAFPILPVPLFIEAIILMKKNSKAFNPLGNFLGKTTIIYLLPLVILGHGGGRLNRAPIRLEEFMSGNYFSIAAPLQMTSSLFVDKAFLVSTLGKHINVSTGMDWSSFLIIEFVLLIFTIVLSLIIKDKKRFGSFAVKIITLTLFLQIFLYLLGRISSKVPLIISFYQASLGGYFLIFGLILSREWWFNQRENKVIVLMVAAWFWALVSEILIFINTYRWEMIENSNDRYILVCSLGSVLFMAGIFYLIIEAIKRVKNYSLRVFSIILWASVILLITVHSYNLLNGYFYSTYNSHGTASYWQEYMYRQFLEKFGRENLKKQAFIYIDIYKDYTVDYSFEYGSLVNLLPFRIYYDEKGNIIRDNCKAVITNWEVLEKAYTVKDGEKGFLYETGCIAPLSNMTGIIGNEIFYPLSDFYAYGIVDKQLIDIKKGIISKLEQSSIQR